MGHTKLCVTKDCLSILTWTLLASIRVLDSTMWMRTGLGSQEVCSPPVVGEALPMGSWTVATGPVSALKRPMTWAAGLLFTPPTETAILEASSIVRDQHSHSAALGPEGGFGVGALGEAQRQGGGFQRQQRGADVPVAGCAVCCHGLQQNLVNGTCRSEGGSMFFLICPQCTT